MNNLLLELNSVQQKAVCEINGPVLIIAGAGSGKTRVLTFRIAHLIHNNISPNSILSLTFTNKAAEEMKSRIMKVLNVESLPIWAGTFHSIFARILRKEAQAIGYDRNFTIYDSDDSLSVVKKIMNELNISTQQYNPKSIRNLISISKNNLIDEKKFSENSKFGIELIASKIYSQYSKELLKSNAMDFDDLLINMIKLFEKNKNILEKYQDRFKYILVDEYQDTNKAQYKIINLLANKYKNICVVGDDAQSIYSFRGADISNILDFEKDYPNAKTFRLEQNYRSTKSILGVADSVIKFNRNQIEKNLWTENIEGEKVKIKTTIDEKGEAKFVVSNILEQLNNNYTLNDFVVLYRTNAQSRAIEDELRRNAVAYKIVGGIEFYQRKEIKDVLAYLKLIVNPKDNESFLRVINYPTRGIGNTTIEKIKIISKSQMWGDVNYLELLKDENNLIGIAEKTRSSLINFKKLIDKYSNLLNEMNFGEVIRSLIDESGIIKILKDENSIESLERLNNIYELLSAISEFIENKEEPTLSKFLEEVALLSSIDKYDENKNAVTIMTLHATKGLEFKNVFIIGVEEGLLPIGQSIQNPNEVEEERRLFYVGITRAMERLTILNAKTRNKFGEFNYSIPSRFIDEINKKFINIENDTDENNFRFVKKRIKTFYNDEKHFNYENESQELENIEIKIGSFVEHDVFGKGKVTHLVGKGENKKAIVWFEEVGSKNLMIKYAPMRILN